MLRSKYGLKVPGLCLMVLGMMTFGMSAAQAETGAYWSLKNAQSQLIKIGTSGLLPSLAGALEAGGGSLLSTIAGVPTMIHCLKMELIGIKLEGNGSLTNGGKAKFTECDTFLKGVLSAACTPKSPGKGEILTNAFKGLRVLHALKDGSKHDAVRIEPSTGTVLVHMTLGEEEECSIGELIPISGTLSVWDKENGLNYIVTHLIEPFTPLTSLTALGNAATLDGTATVNLAGSHSGLSWTGTPG